MSIYYVCADKFRNITQRNITVLEILWKTPEVLEILWKTPEVPKILWKTPEVRK